MPLTDDTSLVPAERGVFAAHFRTEPIIGDGEFVSMAEDLVLTGLDRTKYDRAARLHPAGPLNPVTVVKTPRISTVRR